MIIVIILPKYGRRWHWLPVRTSFPFCIVSLFMPILRSAECGKQYAATYRHLCINGFLYRKLHFVFGKCAFYPWNTRLSCYEWDGMYYHGAASICSFEFRYSSGNKPSIAADKCVDSIWCNTPCHCKLEWRWTRIDLNGILTVSSSFDCCNRLLHFLCTF